MVPPYAPVNRCIYCGAPPEREELTDEHIIPLSLGGTVVLPKASCKPCASLTSAFEGDLARHMFEPSRAHFGWKSRRRRKPPDMLPAANPASGPPVLVPRDAHPPAVVEPILRSQPHIMTGRPLAPNYGPNDALPITIHVTPGPGYAERFKELPRHGAAGPAMEMRTDTFFRTIAKIAHAYSVAEQGVDGFEHILVDIIMGRTSDYPNYMGTPFLSTTPAPTLHRVHGSWHGDLLVTVVRLYAGIGAPPQVVVSGRRKRSS